MKPFLICAAFLGSLQVAMPVARATDLPIRLDGDGPPSWQFFAVAGDVVDMDADNWWYYGLIIADATKTITNANADAFVEGFFTDNTTSYVCSLGVSLLARADAVSTSPSVPIDSYVTADMSNGQVFTVLPDPNVPSLDEGTLVAEFNFTTAFSTDWSPTLTFPNEFELIAHVGNSWMAISRAGSSDFAVDMVLQGPGGPFEFSDTMNAADLQDFLVESGPFIGSEPIAAGNIFYTGIGLTLNMGGTTTNAMNDAETSLAGIVTAHVVDAH